MGDDARKTILMVWHAGQHSQSTDTVDSIEGEIRSARRHTLTDKGRVINAGDVIDGGRDAESNAVLSTATAINGIARASKSVDMEVGRRIWTGIDEFRQ